jgi:hypothetical protein
MDTGEYLDIPHLTIGAQQDDGNPLDFRVFLQRGRYSVI